MEVGILIAFFEVNALKKSILKDFDHANGVIEIIRHAVW